MAAFFYLKEQGKRALEVYIDTLQILEDRGVYRTVIGEDKPTDWAGWQHQVELAEGFEVGRYTIRSAFRRIAQPLSTLLSELIVEQFETSWISRILNALNAPIALETDSEAYYAEMAKRSATASMASVAALRVYEEQDGKLNRLRLKCVALCDEHRAWPSLKPFDIDSELSPAFPYYDKFADEFRALTQPVATNPPVLVLRRHTDHELFEIMEEHISGLSLNTIVFAPLAVGGQLTGFITMGYVRNVNLTSPLKSAFASMANHAAIAIANFQKLSQISALQEAQILSMVQEVQLELLQGFRHAAVTANAQALTYARMLDRQFQFKGEPDKNPLPKLRESLENIHTCLANITSLGTLRQTSDEVEDCDLIQCFDEACQLLKMRLEKQGVEPKKLGLGRAVMKLNKETVGSVRTAFANLLLNSIEAFRDAKANRNSRQIILNVSRTSSNLILDYSDNGPGVRVGQGGIKQVRDIWERGKTSKKDGSGHGLPMVRQVFQGLLGGSIDLKASSDAGVLFRISLPPDGK